jgi:hypothetical protein
MISDVPYDAKNHDNAPVIYPVIHERGYVKGNFKVISRRAFRLLELIRKYGFDKVRAEICTALADGDEPDLHGLMLMKRLRKAKFTFEEVCRAVVVQWQWEDEIRARDSKPH